MFGTYSFGKVAFGRTSGESIEVQGLPYSSADFLPPYLAEQTLYEGLTSVLDYLLYKYHYEEIQKIAGLYDVFHPSFDEEMIIDFLGGSEFIVQPLTSEQKKTLCLMLSSLYEVKGLRRGIEGILSAIGIPALIYESWEIAREVETGESARKDIFSSAIWTEKIDQCSVALVFDTTGRLALRNVDTDIKKAVESLLWVCARIHSYMWVMNFRGIYEDKNIVSPETTTDESSWVTYQSFCDKYKFISEDDWCILFKPIIECLDTPDEDKVLAIFTEHPPITDITVNRIYESDTYDGFILVDWSQVYDEGHIWLLGPPSVWGYNIEDKEAEIYYSVHLPETDPAFTPPLFYSLSKNHGVDNEPLTGTFMVSFKLESDRTIPLVCTMIPESSYADYVQTIESAGITEALSVLDTLVIKATDGRSFIQIIPTTNGEKEVVLWPISADSELLTLCIQGILGDQSSVHLKISDFKVRRIDFTPIEYTSYPRYSAFREYYLERPARTLFRGYAKNYMVPALSTITIPFTLEDGQLLYFTENTNMPFPFFVNSNSYYYVVNSVIDYAGATTFQLTLAPSGSPIDFSTLDNTGYLYYFEFVCETFNKKQLGTSRDQKFGWVFEDDGSMEASDRDGYILNNVLGNLEIDVDYPNWGQKIYYTFNEVSKLQDVLVSLLPIPMAGAVAISYTIVLEQGELEISMGTQEYSQSAETFQISKATDIFNTPGTYNITLKDPGYIPVTSQSFILQIANTQEVGINKAYLNSFTINFTSNTLSIPKSSLSILSSDVKQVYVYEEGSPKLIGTGVYYIVNYSEAGDPLVATFSLSLSDGGPVIDLGSSPLNDDLTYMYVPPKATVKNILVEIDDEVFIRSSDGNFTFEEVTDPEDPDYWEVNEDSHFWMVATEQDSYCCPDIPESLIGNENYSILELGNVQYLSDLYEDPDPDPILGDWNLEDETSEVVFESIEGHTESPDSSLITVGFKWANGTQVRIYPSSQGNMPKEFNGTSLIGYDPLDPGHEPNVIYYTINHSNPSAGVYKIKLANSYANATALTPVWIQLMHGESLPNPSEVFRIAGSKLPPGWREIFT